MTIDWWTLGLQTVNVVILIWLLEHFFWHPVADMIATRRAAAQQMLAEAQSSRDAAAAARAEIDRMRAGFGTERQAMLAATQASAEKLRAEQLAQAAHDADALRGAAQADIDRHRLEAEQDWKDEAGHLAVDIAGRLARRLDGAAVNQAFRDWLLAAVAALPEAQRQALAAPGQAVVVTSATPLTPTEQTELTDALAQALNSRPSLSFATDPDLIAGLELHGASLVIANSWRADLNHILADIRDAKTA